MLKKSFEGTARKTEITRIGTMSYYLAEIEQNGYHKSLYTMLSELFGETKKGWLDKKVRIIIEDITKE